MIRNFFLGFVFVSLLLSCGSTFAQPSDTNYDESRVPSYQLPEIMVDLAGHPVTELAQWEARREEIVELFEDAVYGRTPEGQLPVRYELKETDPNALQGLATRKQVSVIIGDDQLRMEILMYVPNRRSADPVPVFLGLNFYGNQTVHHDPAIAINPRWMRDRPGVGIENNRATEKSRGAYASRWQVETILRRGYGLVTMYYGDVDPDNYQHDFSDGVHPLFYRAGQQAPDSKEWGAIGAWAWGLSRVLDYLETDSDVDAKRVAVLGHSRLGKTALWAGATDRRFALAISNNSGCGGAALYRRCYGERVHHMIKPIGYWFCYDHRDYQKREDDLPIDQHMLLSLIAPRPLYVASAVGDRWADPKGEFLAAKFAGPAYELHGKSHLGDAQFPRPDQPLHTTIGYHVRSGKHDVTAYDWQQYLRFADEHLRSDAETQTNSPNGLE